MRKAGWLRHTIQTLGEIRFVTSARTIGRRCGILAGCGAAQAGKRATDDKLMSYPSKVHSGPELSSPAPPVASAQHGEIGPCVPLTPKVDWRGTAQHIAIGRSPPPEQLQAPAVGWLARYLRGPLTKCARRLLRAMTQTCDAEQHLQVRYALSYAHFNLKPTVIRTLACLIPNRSLHTSASGASWEPR